jgi:hypothetical protein
MTTRQEAVAEPSGSIIVAIFLITLLVIVVLVGSFTALQLLSP